MPDPSHRPYRPMNIIRPDSMPRLWWLNPWATCRYLHQALVAVNALADRQDAMIQSLTKTDE